MDALPPLDLGLGSSPRPDLEFVYVGDPMCSWCWGFSPALERLEERYAVPLRVVMGGLRTGQQAQPWMRPLARSSPPTGRMSRDGPANFHRRRAGT